MIIFYFFSFWGVHNHQKDFANEVLLITNCREHIHVGLVDIENQFCTEVECRYHRIEVLSNYQFRFSLSPSLSLFPCLLVTLKHLLSLLPLFFSDLSMDWKMFLIIIEKKILYTTKTDFLCIGAHDTQNIKPHTS